MIYGNASHSDAFLTNVCQNIFNKTGVINDPLGQPTVPTGSDCRWILKFCAGCTDDNMCENSDHYIPAGTVVGGLVDQLLLCVELTPKLVFQAIFRCFYFC